MSISNILQKLNLQSVDFSNDVTSIDEALSQYSAKKCSEKSVLKMFTLLNKKYPLNPLLLGRLLIFLQLVNDADVLDKVALKDIGLLYERLTNIYKDDVELNIESFYFIYNIEDKEDKARKALVKFRKRIDKKITTIEKSL